MPVLDRLAGLHRASGLIVLAINVADRRVDYAAHIEGNGYEHIWFARDSKGEVARLYGVRSLPATYLLDREGVIRYARAGFGRGLERQLEDEIADLLD